METSINFTKVILAKIELQNHKMLKWVIDWKVTFNNQIYKSAILMSFWHVHDDLYFTWELSQIYCARKFQKLIHKLLAVTKTKLENILE